MVTNLGTPIDGTLGRLPCKWRLTFELMVGLVPTFCLQFFHDRPALMNYKKIDAASYGRVATEFDCLMELLSAPIAMRMILLGELNSSDCVLDIGTVTGLVALRGAPLLTEDRVIAVDHSRGMAGSKPPSALNPIRRSCDKFNELNVSSAAPWTLGEAATLGGEVVRARGKLAVDRIDAFRTDSDPGRGAQGGCCVSALLQQLTAGVDHRERPNNPFKRLSSDAGFSRLTGSEISSSIEQI